MSELAAAVDHKLGDLPVKPFDDGSELTPLDYVQTIINNLKKVENEESLKQLVSEVQSFWSLSELAESVWVACDYLAKAKKDREKRDT